MQNDLFLKKAEYIFDTSSFIALRKTYPEDIFVGLHKQLIPILASGRIVVLDMVFAELKDKELQLYDLIKSAVPKKRQFGFEDYIETTQELIHNYYDSKGKTQNLKSDPHIIAVGKIEKLTVISEEFNSDPTKIPYVCDKEKVECMDLLEFMRKEKIKLT